MNTSGFYTTKDNRKIYFEFDYKNNPDACVVFLNGLSDTIENWKPVRDFLKTEHSFLFVDLIGQGKALESELVDASKDSKFFDYKISVETQALALKELLEHLKISIPIDLVGFSYGGGVAIRFGAFFPNLINRLILFLPFLIRLDLAFPIQRLWAGQFNFFKNVTPLRPGINALDKSYHRMMRDYMNFRFSKHIPDATKRSVSMDLTEGIMDYNAFNFFSLLPDNSVHLITVDKDTLVPRTLYREAWDRLPENKKISWLKIEDGEHLIFEQAPLFCVEWIEKILNNELSENTKKYVGRAFTMEVEEVINTTYSRAQNK